MLSEFDPTENGTGSIKACRDRIKWFGITNYESLFTCSESNTTPY